MNNLGRNIKLTIEEVREIIKCLGYILISKEYLGISKKLIMCDVLGYYYTFRLNDINSGRLPRKFSKSNIYTIQNIKLWCKLENKEFELISDIYKGSKVKLKWKCLKEECGEIFEAEWDNIQSGNRGCPFCSGHKVGLSNCLATKNPKLAKEWHPTLNGDLTPYDVTEHSGKYVWWKCSKNSKHEWRTMIADRSDNNCPYCRGYYPSEDHNLLFNNPKLCEEWNYDKNDKLPSEYTPYTMQSVWWKCRDCGNEWEDTINHRNNDRGCHQCNKPKGENKCKEVFINYSFVEINQRDYFKLPNKNDNTYFIPQQKFIGLVGIGNGPLSYDFYIPKYNLLIEYQGEFHDGTAKIQTKEGFEIQKEHDKRKKEYALSNGYNFLEIWYYDFDSIEEILNKYLGGEK